MWRAEFLVVAGSLAALLTLAGCTGDRAAPEVAARTAARTPPVAVVSQGSEVQPLRPPVMTPAPWVAPTRNPFRFGRSTGGSGRTTDTSGLPPLPPPDGLPMLPLPVAQPALRLLGVLTFADGGKMAVLSVGADLVMARTGEMVGSRFRLVSIADDSVEIDDAAGQRPTRLALP